MNEIERPPLRVLDPVTELCPKGPDFSAEGGSRDDAYRGVLKGGVFETLPHSVSGLDWLDQIGY